MNIRRTKLFINSLYGQFAMSQDDNRRDNMKNEGNFKEHFKEYDVENEANFSKNDKRMISLFKMIEDSDNFDIYGLDIVFQITQFSSSVQIMSDFIIGKSPAELYMVASHKLKKYYDKDLCFALYQDIQHPNSMFLKVSLSI